MIVMVLKDGKEVDEAEVMFGLLHARRLRRGEKSHHPYGSTLGVRLSHCDDGKTASSIPSWTKVMSLDER